MKVWGKSTVGAFQEVKLPITKTTRTSADVRPAESSGLLSLLTEMVPESIKNAYENIGPEGRIGLTVLLSYLLYLLISSYRSRRGAKSPQRKTRKKHSNS